MDEEKDDSEISYHVDHAADTNDNHVNSIDDDDNDAPLCSQIVEMSLILLVLVVALISEFVSGIPQHERPIPVQQVTTGNGIIENIVNLNYDLDVLNESIDDIVLIVVGVVIPLIVQLVMATVLKSCKTFQLERYNIVASCVLGFGLTLLVINSMKLYTGVLRPHFYAVCQPNEGYDECTNDSQSDLRTIRDSFPSGHAGLSMVGLANLALYLHRRCGVGKIYNNNVTKNKPEQGYSFRKHQAARLWSAIALLPIFIALFIGCSRIYDDYHHPSDVVAGTAVGAVVAYACHWFYFVE